MKVDDTVGPLAKAACESLGPGGIVMLENVRFNPGEKKGDVVFARQMAASPTATSTTLSEPATAMKPRWLRSPEQFPPDRRAHRLPGRKRAAILETLLAIARAPVTSRSWAGAKVSDKISVIQNLIKRVDKLLIGGAMTYTFLKARGIAVGKSKVEADKLDVAKGLLDLAGRQARPAQGPPGRFQPEAGAETKVVAGSRTSRMDGSGWTSGPRRSPSIPRSSSKPARSSGTDRWACSRSSYLRRARKAIAQALADSQGGDGRRRRRVSRSRREIRAGRAGDARFDRRRRVSGVARGKVVQLAQGHPRRLNRTIQYRGFRRRPTIICLTSP